MSDPIEEPSCVSCNLLCGSHSCKICNKPCHAIEPCCVSEMNDDDEEGFGAPVTCKSCYDKNEEVPPKSTSSTKMWNWKRKATDVSSSDTKKKVNKTTNESNTNLKFTCIECYTIVMDGSSPRAVKTSTLCRKNPSSIKEHKDR